MLVINNKVLITTTILHKSAQVRRFTVISWILPCSSSTRNNSCVPWTAVVTFRNLETLKKKEGKRMRCQILSSELGGRTGNTPVSPTV